LFAGLIGATFGVVVTQQVNNRDDSRIANFYADEMATVVSPQTIKKYIDEDNKDYILVDLRSKPEYDKEHIKNAINIPASSLNEDELVAAFKQLGTDKQVIVHCYSAYCTLGRQVGNTLAQNGVFVKEMTAGWSEWRYHWDLWNPGASIDAGESYITKNDSSSDGLITPCTDGVFGC
jgi:rhodanese-related sulfurtransferase